MSLQLVQQPGDVLQHQLCICRLSGEGGRRREVAELRWFDCVSGTGNRPRHMMDVLGVVNPAEEFVKFTINTLLRDEQTSGRGKAKELMAGNRD